MSKSELTKVDWIMDLDPSGQGGRGRAQLF
ncbi:hypothetical protein CCACVL1_23023 [Corchorus capsularis]|uniref:Uncharacterized protein n=1 Tax=Corchorus capsularis TaxID=210143 RepID=A0A1R3GVJ8_COCAP|nr:hypothetical protein CCACVL1_23023 [Corchorus capsularis]